MQDHPPQRSLPDIVAYLMVALVLWPLVALVFKQRLVKKFTWLPIVVSVLAVVTLVSVDIVLPVYHSLNSHSRNSLRPAYATHALLACYIFLPLQNNIYPAALGLGVTVCHLLSLGLVTYRNSTTITRQVFHVLFLPL